MFLKTNDRFGSPYFLSAFQKGNTLQCNRIICLLKMHALLYGESQIFGLGSCGSLVYIKVLNVARQVACMEGFGVFYLFVIESRIIVIFV